MCKFHQTLTASGCQIVYPTECIEQNVSLIHLHFGFPISYPATKANDVEAIALIQVLENPQHGRL